MVVSAFFVVSGQAGLLFLPAAVVNDSLGLLCWRRGVLAADC